jgi:hypothetical protein
MKKLWIGLGIGCGGLILIAVIGISVAGYYGKKALGGVIEVGQKMQAQQAELDQLNRDFPFTSPAGALPKLDDDRVQTYLSIRDELAPVVKDFKAKGEAFDKKYKGASDNSISATVEAAKLMSELMQQMRGKFIASLKSHRMSPAEFQTISTTILESRIAQAAGGSGDVKQQLNAQADAMQQQLDAPGFPAASKDAMRKQVQALRDQAARSNPADQQTAAANSVVIAKYQARIDDKETEGTEFLLFQTGGASGPTGSSMATGSRAAEEKDDAPESDDKK